MADHLLSMCGAFSPYGCNAMTRKCSRRSCFALRKQIGSVTPFRTAHAIVNFTSAPPASNPRLQTRCARRVPGNDKRALSSARPAHACSPTNSKTRARRPCSAGRKRAGNFPAILILVSGTVWVAIVDRDFDWQFGGGTDGEGKRITGAGLGKGCAPDSRAVPPPWPPGAGEDRRNDQSPQRWVLLGRPLD